PPIPLLFPYTTLFRSDWPRSGWQIDQHFTKYLPPPHRVSRKNQLGDGIMTVIVLATCNQQQAPASSDPNTPIPAVLPPGTIASEDRKSTRLNSSHVSI